MMEAAPSTRFAQKNVLITGAAAGLGRHIARAFAAEGADIAILDFQDASATVREITALGRRSEFFWSDVRDEDGVKTAVAGAAEFFGERIDVLVKNAAAMPFLCSVDASAMTGQAINVTGGFIMT
jgi:2-hydroxycyclohexanecarboxyl-CoA dehydrogenase